MSQRVDPKILADIEEPRDVCLSPDGRRIVYTCRPFWVLSSKNITCSLWVAEVGKEKSAGQITNGDFYHGSPQFSPDGKYVSFLSDRASPGGALALYLLSLEGNEEPSALTDKDNGMSVGDYKWKPDGKSIAFTSADKKAEERKGKGENTARVNVRGEDPICARIQTIDLATKEINTLTDGKRHVAALEWNVEGTDIVYCSYQGPSITEMEEFGACLHILNVSDSTSRELCRFKSLLSGLSWIGDKILWITSTVKGSDTSSRTVFSMDAHDASKDIQGVAYGQTDCAYSIKRCSGRIVAQVFRGLADVVETLDGTEIYSGNHQITSCDVNYQSEDGPPIIALSYGTTGRPVEIFSIVDGKQVQLSQHSEHISRLDIARAHLCEYTHDDGTPITGYYAIPTAHESSFQNRKARPTVVIVHGGPYMRATDSFDHFFNWAFFFLSLGYQVLIPNYRGGCGHGQAYAHAVYQNIASSYDDVAWLVKKGVSEGYIDKDRIAVTGWSLGGYLSYLAATRDRDFHFQAVVAGAGISDWSSLASTTDIPFWASHLSGTSPWDADDDVDIEAVIRARKNSPLYHVKNVKSPVLIIHGEKDARVPIEQAVGFYRGMKSRGMDVEFVSYPDEGHGWPVGFQKANYVDMMERMETFITKHLGPA